MQRWVSFFFLTVLSCAYGSSVTKKRFDLSPMSVAGFTRDLSMDSLNGSTSSATAGASSRTRIRQNQVLLSGANDEIAENPSYEDFHSETLVRFYEGALEGKEQLRQALMSHVQLKSNEAVISVLSYCYLNQYRQAFLAVVEAAHCRLPEIITLIEDLGSYTEEFVSDVKSFCSKLGDDSDYVFVEPSDWTFTSRPFLSIDDFMNLEPHRRLPAAVRQILEIPVMDCQVTSSFITNNVLNRFDLRTILVLYEIEMMDILHLHDTKGVIESYLKRAILFENNIEMAKLAHQMYINFCFHALKIIVDEKFSYESPLKNPFWFQDLYSLFKFATDNFIPGDFQNKVMQLAKPSAIRHYVAKTGLTALNF